MQTTTALRLYGKRDLRSETFTLPAMQDDEILARVVTDSLCLSSWKEANQGADHKKVPDDVATSPLLSVMNSAAKSLPSVKSSISFSRAALRDPSQPAVARPTRLPRLLIPMDRWRSHPCGDPQ